MFRLTENRCTNSLSLSNNTPYGKRPVKISSWIAAATISAFEAPTLFKRFFIAAHLIVVTFPLSEHV
ncbi:hypothetical protein BSU04_26815 [Caballeronia sordidicola]|uniref:Uncharacterized protein n=1 Tax=Caballeronia sordidicola TaxID=196367 RepID=A0A226WXX4_CABSO|nr:hypothetical protein BSU04_26815 [Caballeronia sordidicola]